MSAALPPLYDRWITSLLGVTVESEPRATCLDCAMLPDKQPEYPPFAVESKCCTYTPDVYNFTVGNVLRDGDSPAASWLGARIAAGVGVTPFGVTAPGPERTLYLEAVKSPATFGRVPSLRCPFYIEAGGLCGIHLHRDAICSTWFCKFERGAAGKIFWTVLKNLLKQIERNLARHCILNLELGPEAFARVMLADPFVKRGLDDKELNRVAGVDTRRQLWGRYHEREREFFVASAELVNGLSWDDVLAIGGMELAAGARMLRHVHDKLTGLPSAVLRGTAGLIQISPRPELARLRNPSVFTDHAEVPAALLAYVPRLVGRPLGEAMAELAAEGIAVDETFVRRLLDYQVLVATQDNSRG